MRSGLVSPKLEGRRWTHSLRPPAPNARCDLGHRSAMRGGARGYGWRAASGELTRRLSAVARSAEVDSYQGRKSAQTARHDFPFIFNAYLVCNARRVMTFLSWSL